MAGRLSGKGILSNIRILDFSRVLAGPYATRILADFGAEVIKVQPLLPAEEEGAFARGYYNTWNRNKQGITLNLNRAEGVAIARRLAALSDAVVENFTPRVMANWGLDYGHLREIKPDLIMLSMSAMGGSGPCRDYAGFAPTVHAFSGMTHLTSFPGEPPAGPGFACADHIAGLVAALALLGALEYRRRTGEGQYIDISQVEVMAGLLGGAVLGYTAGGSVPEPAGNRSPEAAPHGIYRCRGDDRWCAIAVSGDEEWRRFCRALGEPPWTQDSRFATLPRRQHNVDELDRLVEEWTGQHTPQEAMALLQKEGVACGAVQDARDLANDPQLKARGFFVERDGAISDAVPIRLSATPAEYRRAAPLPGEDNDSVYRGLLGMGEDEVLRLREEGVI